MDTKRRAGGVTISGAWIAGFGRELLTRDPGDTIDLLGDVMSPESFFLAMTVLGLGGLAYFGWPAMQWICGVPQWLWEIPKRHRRALKEKKLQYIKKKREAERKHNEFAVMKLEGLQECLRRDMSDQWKRNNNAVENRAKLKIFLDDLRKLGLALSKGDGTVGSQRLHTRVSRILPFVRRYGIEQTIIDHGEDIS